MKLSLHHSDGTGFGAIPDFLSERGAAAGDAAIPPDRVRLLFLANGAGETMLELSRSRMQSMSAPGGWW